jgi:DNA-binding MarR family transcriptional regulator
MAQPRNHRDDLTRPVTGLTSIAGYLIRRSQQVHTALWAANIIGDLTGPQYAVLSALSSFPHVPQQRAGQLASLDKSSAADVVNRLVAKGWVTRERDQVDSRRYVLSLTPAASIALSSITPHVESVQQALLRPLGEKRRRLFCDRLQAVARRSGDDSTTERAIPTLNLRAPGHLIRCAQQVHTALWAEIVGAQLTGPQFAVLHVVNRWPGINQTQLGELAALDKSSTADVVARLLARDMLIRERDASDGRGRVLYVPDPTARRLSHLYPLVRQVQQELLAPLPEPAQAAFLSDLARVAFAGKPPTVAE